MNRFPYKDVPESKWQEITAQLIELHPLDQEEIVEVVLLSWASIFKSRIGQKGFRIGKHIFPRPQIMGFFLHELISLEFASRYPGIWRGEVDRGDKDLVYIPENFFSLEIKTSSHGSQVFGNRSYAQEIEGGKGKSGYYLTVNFGKFNAARNQPLINRIRFGWLDHSDWLGQKAATGQQARIISSADRHKLLTLFDAGTQS